MNNDLIRTYSYRISQANRSQLVVVIYDLAIDYLKEACQLEKVEEKRHNIVNAGRAIDQLIVGLNMEFDLSQNLFIIYNHIKRSLISASVKLDNGELERVIALLSKLRKSFYEVSKADESAPLMKNTQNVYAGLTYSRLGACESVTNNTNRGYIV